MADKHLEESGWKAFAKSKGYGDGPVLKALAALAKEAKSSPQDQIEALDEVDKQAAALAKSNKADKELAAWVAEMDKEAERRRKDLRAQAEKEAAAEADEEGGGNAMLTTRLLTQLRQLRKGGELHAMVALQGKGCAVMLAKRGIGPASRKLMTEYLDESGAAKFVPGMCSFEGNTYTFALEGSAGGLAKKLQKALLAQTEMRTKVKVRGADPDDVDEAEEEDGAPGETPTSGPVTPVTPVTDESATTQSETTADSPLVELQRRYDALAPLLKRALAAPGADAGKLRAVSGFLQGKLEAGEEASSRKALETLTALIKQCLGAGADTSPGTTSTAPPKPVAPPPPVAPSTPGSGGSFVQMQKARLVWLQTRQAVQGELKKLEASILAEFKNDPAFADAPKEVRRLDQVMSVLDEELADILDAALNASEEGERRRLQNEAREQLEAYGDYVASDSFVAELDGNPFVPLKIKDTVTRSLAVLSKTLS